MSANELCSCAEGAPPLTIYFDDIYVASILKELEYRGLKVEPGLTEEELRAVEAAVGAPLPPDLRLFLRGGLLSGEGFPNWRDDPETEMQRTRDWVRRAFASDIKGNQWWFDGWGPRPSDFPEALRVALEHLTSAPALVPIYSHRFMTTEPLGYGNPVLSVYSAVDSIYYGYDLAHYLHREFGVPRPPWSADIPPRAPFWGDVFDLFSEQQSGRAPAQRDDTADDTGSWQVALEIISPHPPDTVSAALGIQPSRVEVDDEGSGHLGEDGEWQTTPLYTWAVDSRLPIPNRFDVLGASDLEPNIKDVLRQVGGCRMALVAVSGWPEVDIVLSARLPLRDVIDSSDEPGDDAAPAASREADFDLDAEIMASLAQMRARLVVTYQ